MKFWCFIRNLNQISKVTRANNNSKDEYDEKKESNNFI